MVKHDVIDTLRSWIQNISNNDFQNLVNDYVCEDTARDNITNTTDRNNIAKITDDAIIYQDGSKYVGDIEDEQPVGKGQLILANARILRLDSIQIIFIIYMNFEEDALSMEFLKVSLKKLILKMQVS